MFSLDPRGQLDLTGEGSAQLLRLANSSTSEKTEAETKYEMKDVCGFCINETIPFTISIYKKEKEKKALSQHLSSI